MENKEKPTHTVGVLIISRDKVLLVRHGETAGHLTGSYGLPGGRANENESETETAIRETKEETNLDVNAVDLSAIPDLYKARIERKDGAKDFTMRVFVSEKFGGEIIGTDETTPKWVDINNLNSYKLLPNVDKMIKDGLEIVNLTLINSD